jgi:hypothetical protein
MSATEAEILEMIAKLEVALLLAQNPSDQHTALYHARRALLWVLHPESAPSPVA